MIIAIEKWEAELIEEALEKALKILRKIKSENCNGNFILIEYPAFYHFGEIYDHAQKIFEIRGDGKNEVA
jgi:hypothetical protein